MASAPEMYVDGAWVALGTAAKGFVQISDRMRTIRVRNIADGERSDAILTSGFDKAIFYAGENFTPGAATAALEVLGQLPGSAVLSSTPDGSGFSSVPTITTGGTRLGGYLTQLPSELKVGHSSTGWTMDIVVELRCTKAHAHPGDH